MSRSLRRAQMSLSQRCRGGLAAGTALVVALFGLAAVSFSAPAGAAPAASAPAASATARAAKPAPRPAPKVVAKHYSGPRRSLGQHTDRQRASTTRSQPRAASTPATAPTAPATAPAAGSDCGNPNMCSRGGPVMSDVVIYNIYLAPDGTTAPNRSLIDQFTGDLGGPFVGMLGQYGVSNRVDFGGAWPDTTPLPSDRHDNRPVFSDGDVQQAVTDAKNANSNWKAPGLGVLYMVYLPTGSELCGSGCTYDSDGFCAYHSSFEQDGDTFVYGAMPFDGDRMDVCGIGTRDIKGTEGSAGPNNDTANDAEISTASHEIFEAMTDPEPGADPAWRDGVNPLDPGFLKDEIGDMCSYVYNPDADGGDLTLGGHRYFIQQEWSNDSSSCELPSAAIYPSTPTGQSALAQNYPACVANTLPRNDDGSTDEVSLPFSVDFFSRTFNSLWVNNNGNVTFDGPQWTYTPYGLQATSHEIIAPYFADVDTRDLGSREVTYGGEAGHDGKPAYFCVNWVNVGYYGYHSDRLNSFQLVLIDRSAQTHLAGDFDIIFNYDKVQWETGDASGGSGGLGGSPAVAGYSNGTNAALELPGSAFAGSFEDDGIFSLAQGGRGSATPGRYIFPVRNSGAPTGGTIHGTVTTDLFQTLVKDAPVQICDPDSGACTLTQSNDQGRYSVGGLPPATYDVTVMPPKGSYLFPDYEHVDLLTANGDVTEDIDMVDTFLPPDDVDIDYHRVTANGIPVLEWGGGGQILYSGVPNCTVTATFSLNNGAASRQVSLEHAPVATWIYSAPLPDFKPLSGAATVTVHAVCQDDQFSETEKFNIYVDPSGVVVDQNGNPVAGATVTLLRADSAAGPFSAVPDSSALMSPGNRANPDLTTVDGTFGWDVLTGYYQVSAHKDGCTDPADPSSGTVTSAVFPVPPAVADLRLVLSCTGDTTAPQLTTNPLSLEANATGGYQGSLGGVTVTDPDDAASSITLTNDAVSLLPLGANTVTWTATDPAGNKSTAQQSVTVLDTTAPAISCPAGIDSTYTANPALGAPSVSDIADASPVLTNDAPATFPAGTTTVTWTATDHSGNAGHCTQLVTLRATTALLYTGSQIVNLGSAVTPTATLSSAATSCVGGQPITFTLDRDPTTGAAGAYLLATATTSGSGLATGSGISSSGWQDGVYEVTAAYAGTANACGSSTDTATLTIASPGAAATGGGWYTLPGSGRANFGFTVKKLPSGAYSGQFTLVNNGKWRLNGALTSYVKTGTSGAVSGTGTLYWWDATLNGGLGGWALAGNGVAFTASFTDKGANGSKTADTFGVHISYSPAPAQQQLPNSSPVVLKGGGINIS